MSCYLKEAEIPKYCGLYAGITMAHVEAASALIDAYKGCTFEPVKHKERVRLERRGYSDELRGKLIHYPRVKVFTVKADVYSPFGQAPEQVMVDTGCVQFDDDESQYFTFYMPRQLMFELISPSPYHRRGLIPIHNFLKIKANLFRLIDNFSNLFLISHLILSYH